MRKYQEIPKQNIFLKCAVRGLLGLIIGAVLGKGVEKLSYDSEVENLAGNAQTIVQYDQDYKKGEFSRGLYFMVPGAVIGLGAGIAAAFAKENDEER